MAARRRTSFPGLSPAATQELIGLQEDSQADTAVLRQEAIGSTTDTKTASGYAAKYNEIIRVQFPAAGGSIVFPAAAVGSVNRWIEVLVLTGSGPVKIVPTSLLVDGAASVTLTTAGRYAFRSDGLTSWWRLSGAAGGGGGGGTLAATLALGNASGANNMQIDAGQHVNFGVAGPATSNPQIRSGDATFRIRSAANMFLLADGIGSLAALVVTGDSSTAVLQAQGVASNATVQSLQGNASVVGEASASVISNTGPVSLAAATDMNIATGGVNHVVIDAAGEWTTPPGASGEVWTHQGAGAPPTWAAAGGGGGGGTATDVTATLPYAGKRSDAVTIVDASVSAATKLVISWGTVLAADENNPEDNPVTFTATPAAGSFSLRISSGHPLVPVGGAYKIRYQELT